MKKAGFIDKIKVPNYFISRHTRTGCVEFDPEKCTGCGICTRICPARALELIPRKGQEESKKKLPHLIELTRDTEIKGCMACGDCMAACPEGAISIARGYEAGYYYKKLSQSERFAWPKNY